MVDYLHGYKDFASYALAFDQQVAKAKDEAAHYSTEDLEKCHRMCQGIVRIDRHAPMRTKVAERAYRELLLEREL